MATGGIIAMDFDEAKQAYDNDEISQLAGNKCGLRFLKLKSLSRKEILLAIFAEYGIKHSSKSANDMLIEAYNTKELTDSKIDQFIKKLTTERLHEWKVTRSKLIPELEKVNEYNWGGLYRNELERTIVDSYIKKIDNYNKIGRAIRTSIKESTKAYTLTSWYNHWTSILIEYIFWEQKNVTPAIGKVKKMDFFIDNIPFDLKVTYIPEGFIKQKRKIDRVCQELQLLKQEANARNIEYEKGSKERELYQHLWNEISKVGDSGILKELKRARREYVKQVDNDPSELIQWLYENQGPRRFDSSNRLFVVVADTRNHFESWKLKRDFKLLATKIKAEMNQTHHQPNHKISFTKNGNTYNATARLILVKKTRQN